MTETRTRTEIKFEPEGPEAPGAVRSFRLILTGIAEARRRDTDRWQYMNQKRTVLTSGITRQQVSALIADGAEWLSYIEEQGST